MRSMLSLFFLISFISATKVLLLCKDGEIELTMEQANRCQAISLSELSTSSTGYLEDIKSLSPAGYLENTKLSFPINYLEVAKIGAFQDYPKHILSLFFIEEHSIVTILRTLRKTSEEFLFIELLNYCGNVRDLETCLDFFKKSCKTFNEINSVIDSLEKCKEPYLASVFLSRYSLYELKDLGFLEYERYIGLIVRKIPKLLIKNNKDIYILEKLIGFSPVNRDYSSLDTLSLGSYPIQLDTNITEFIKSLTKLKTLEFFGDYLEPNVDFLETILEKNKNDLSSVCLIYDSSSPMTNWGIIFKKLPDLNCLKELTITRKSLSKIGRDRFPGFLQGFINTNTELVFNSVETLKFNRIDLRSSNFSWKALSKAFPKLNEIDICSCKVDLLKLVGDLEGLKLRKFYFRNNVCEVNQHFGQNIFLQFLDSNPNLEVLDISNNFDGKEGEFFKSLFSELKLAKLTKISSLILAENGLFGNQQVDLSLGNFTSLKILDLQENNLSDSFFLEVDRNATWSLEDLQLSNNPLGSGENLAEFICCLTKLKELNLENCELTPKFIDLLNSCEKFSDLEILNLGFNKIVNSQESFEALMILLSRCPKLELLDLSSIFEESFLSRYNASTFAPFRNRMVFKELTSLYMGGNTSNKTLKYLIQDIAQFAPEIYYLDLNDCNMQKSSARAFGNLIMGGKFMKLKSLNLKGYAIGPEALSILKEALKELPGFDIFVLNYDETIESSLEE